MGSTTPDYMYRNYTTTNSNAFPYNSFTVTLGQWKHLRDLNLVKMLRLTKCIILDQDFETSNKDAGSIQGNSPTGLETPAEHLTGPTLVVYRESADMIRRRNRNIRTYHLRYSHGLSMYGKSSR